MGKLLFDISIKELIKIFSLPFAVLLMHMILMSFGIDNNYVHYDDIMHFLGGVSLGIALPLFFNKLRSNNYLIWKNRYTLLLLCLTTAALIVTTWEFLEFILDFFWQAGAQESLQDTMGDLFLGLFGCFASFILQKNI